MDPDRVDVRNRICVDIELITSQKEFIIRIIVSIAHSHIAVRGGLFPLTWHAFPQKLRMKLAEVVAITEFVPWLRNWIKFDNVGKFET